MSDNREMITPRAFIIFVEGLKKQFNQEFSQLVDNLWGQIPRSLQQFACDYWQSKQKFSAWIESMFRDIARGSDVVSSETCLSIQAENIGPETGFTSFNDVIVKFDALKQAWACSIQVTIESHHQSQHDRYSLPCVRIRFRLIV
ncbi:hypothetical protein A2533_00760 [Candidatus Falkowbacteria bacterium RIFOXYD2_FULL_35_9]|uniref:Uncharacterized protein n=1 Tax=Candidatus Falkowbacteria bacterium RIFOXYC2_FULL_36_12 TaxID=1798002 RepID=A0A1F5T4H8_9BACT|nr:MAG: hypothetical protein A2300_04380 [Candidatus Falkowbacteria bacterium RIFOXYB2_FULL_35_7]OGF33077.1 MAG: hypothetical protein A2223_05065 [Candidatus Falkowbacteria bacterium RIFOXYA2_FULL_35_8]OGF33361.1 MAG: hypothetical protein A2478_01515 [Candidatus Falkowbacteria bacterium RIFOXYC2_FULL_36_12]OGF45606.1 MAG: hypothetical protein A2533_00760 [Candidatus Falkowbacteria bacterium RIFOXYD2_FULL_35_9]